MAATATISSPPTLFVNDAPYYPTYTSGLPAILYIFCIRFMTARSVFWICGHDEWFLTTLRKVATAHALALSTLTITEKAVGATSFWYAVQKQKLGIEVFALCACVIYGWEARGEVGGSGCGEWRRERSQKEESEIDSSLRELEVQ